MIPDFRKLTDIPRPLIYLILAILLYAPLFSHLTAFPLRVWDEARLANNALEMLQNGNYIVTHYDGAPDMWNTKPPLMIWIQVLFMKILGPGELAVRLPSAIAALFTCIALLIFSIRYLRDHWFGFIAVMVLITATGYVYYHVTRTGDYDSLLILFTTLAGLSFFAFCENEKTKWLYAFFVFITLAALTKSVTGLLFSPALFLYALWRKKVISLLRNKHFYLGVTSFLLIVVGYYLLRNHYNPGYLEAVFENDLGGRFSNTIENHSHSAWFYYDNLLNYQFSAWYLLIPCGILAGIFNRDEKIKRITVFSFLMSVAFFAVITMAETKLEWYNAPMYPFLALIVAVFIRFIFSLLKDVEWLRQYFTANPLSFIFLFLLFVNPYRATVDRTYIPKENSWDEEFYEMSYYLRDGLRGKHNLKNQQLCFDGYNGHVKFYVDLLNEKGMNIHFKDWTDLSDGETVFTFQENIKEYLSENYRVDTLEQFYGVITYKIYERKPSTD